MSYLQRVGEVAGVVELWIRLLKRKMLYNEVAKPANCEFPVVSLENGMRELDRDGEEDEG